MNQTLNFQSIMMKLQEFWAEQGCLIWQPYYTQVGAGTYNPATFLRALGPEPWRVGYVEPSIRPDDARYGENPNRMQMHYQFQVILKPDPGNPQDIYLQSLEALGIDPAQHDIRFVEDNWISPALGAWGLGWEVWLDGQEITQFTYFQQAGGIQLDPVSVELTYGLERIAIALQRVNSFTEIQWSPDLTDGDVNLQAEQEHSRYYFEVADIDRLRRMYELFEQEADACLQQGLVLPAHDYVLKCSHTFNVLDTRGAVGVTERQAYFGRMRELSRRVSEAYIEQRKQLEYPWLKEESVEGIRDKVATFAPETPIPYPLTPAPFLFEIGTEELPAGDLDAALQQLSERVPQMLDQLRLEHDAIKVLGTPRRLVVYVDQLSPHQIDLEQIAKGPPADRAFDEDNQPTKAALGFARNKGVDVNDLQVREMDGGKYAVALVRQVGQRANEVLAKALPELVTGLRFDRPMRWNSSNVFFSRPIRWFLALHGERPIQFEYAAINSGNTTKGLRFRQPQEFLVGTAAVYFETLAGQGIILDIEARKAEIRSQIEALATQVDGVIPEDPDLLAEVTNLVEVPTSLLGSFDHVYLELPCEVLISVMKKHQRYFPVVDSSQEKLLPYFIAVRNGDDQHIDAVTAGNEHVIQARFADAAFFVKEDRKKPLESYLSELHTLTFQVKLGSMLDKTQRIVALAEKLAGWLALDDIERDATRRTAELCKADLATQMVIEMTSLQGIMGRYYALDSGEPDAVAEAIFEHYLPRFTGDDIPQTKPGLVVGMADRLDTLVGMFSADLAPSGNKDPFAQRRAALGLVQNLIAWDLDFDLQPAIEAASENLPIPTGAEKKMALQEFIVERLRNTLLDQGDRYDVVDAVLAVQGLNPARAVRAVRSLGSWVARPDWENILPAYARCVRITRPIDERYSVYENALLEPAEAALYQELLEEELSTREQGSVDRFIDSFTPMIPAINRFFDEVLVMTEDESLRQNRLGMLQRIAALSEEVADLSRLESF
ncbi:MAG: glycine--tRNA ligase subunit beta [Chloroflexota bacterium]|nr:glycine--tRNA ligase subunit beta [Chloroflexota bacterium]